MKIGLFFGTYNPIHFGHLIIADYMATYTDLDEVWIIVSPHNPLKSTKDFLKKSERLTMVRLALENNNKLKASDIEFNLPKPSYTINTLSYLQEKYPKDKFILIMGSDNLQSLHLWKNYNKILLSYDIYIYPRPGSTESISSSHPNVKYFDTPLLNISSSFIRKAIKENKSVSYLIPEKVLHYIQKKHFYN